MVWVWIVANVIARHISAPDPPSPFPPFFPLPTRYRLVGVNHELHSWDTPHTDCHPLAEEWERDYDPAELFDSEQWIIHLFEPVRKNFYNGPQPPPMQVRSVQTQ